MLYTHDDALAEGKQQAQPNFEYMKKNSYLDFQVYMMGKPSIQTAQLRADQVYIRGRHGTLMYSDGTYDNITIEFGIRFRSKGMAQDAKKKRDVVKWLRYGYGYDITNVDIPSSAISVPIYQPEGHLRFHHMPDTTFKVKSIAPFAWEWHPQTQQWFTQLSFTCDPFGYSDLKEYKIGTSGAPITYTLRSTLKDAYGKSVMLSSWTPGYVGNIYDTVDRQASRYRDTANDSEYNTLSDPSTSNWVNIGTTKAYPKESDSRNLLRSAWTDPIESSDPSWGGYLGWGEYLPDGTWSYLLNEPWVGRFKYCRRWENRLALYNDDPDEDYLVFYKLWAAPDASILKHDPTYPNTDLRGKPLYAYWENVGGGVEGAVRVRRAGKVENISGGWQKTSHLVNVPSDAEFLELVFRVPPGYSGRIQNIGLFRNAKPTGFSSNVDTSAVFEGVFDVFAMAETIYPSIFQGLSTIDQRIARLQEYGLKVDFTQKFAYWSDEAEREDVYKTIRLGARINDNPTSYRVATRLPEGQSSTFYRKVGSVNWSLTDPARFIGRDSVYAGHINPLLILDSVSEKSAWIQMSYIQIAVTLTIPNTLNTILFRGAGEVAPNYPTILIEVDQTATKVQIDSTHESGITMSFYIDLQVAGNIKQVLVDTETMLVKIRDPLDASSWIFYNGFTSGAFPYISQDYTYFSFKGIQGATFYLREKYLVS